MALLAMPNSKFRMQKACGTKCILFYNGACHYNYHDYIRMSSLIIRADDELVDPKKYLEERCKSRCVKPLFEYRACVKRIEEDETGHKHCTGQYFDYWQCVDKCAAEKLFSKLK